MNGAEIEKLRHFWSVFKDFTEQKNRPEFITDYRRALTRFNQHYAEQYLEDAVIDLAVSLEIITRTGSQKAFASGSLT